MGMLMLRKRVLGNAKEENPSYISELGKVYHRHEVKDTPFLYEDSIAYKNCTYMESLIVDVKIGTSSSYWMPENGFTECPNLTKILIPLGGSTGHYSFSGLPKLKYLQLGSLGNSWGGGGFFRNRETADGKNIYTVGSSAGLTVVAWMAIPSEIITHIKQAGFAYGTVATNTRIIIRNYLTGEIVYVKEPA